MYHPIVGNLWFKTFMSAFFTFVELNEEIPCYIKCEVYPFLPSHWPYKLFIEMSKKICASGFHVPCAFQKKQIFYLPSQALSPQHSQESCSVFHFSPTPL